MTEQEQLLQAIAKAAIKAASKVSSTEPNVANLIAAHIRKVAPRLAEIPGLWFSGSNVWRWLYAGDPPDADADIDVFIMPGTYPTESVFGDQRQVLLTRLGKQPQDAQWPSVRTGRNGDWYAQGCKFILDGRKVDVWEGFGTVADTLNNYPTLSHAHCRAAFSLTDGLVVLPNEAASV